MEQINSPSNNTAPKPRISVIQKLNFFDSTEEETPLSNGVVLLFYLTLYLALFFLVMLFCLLIKWNKTRVQACSDLSRDRINDCYWCLKRICCCCWWCYCPVYLQAEYMVSRVFRKTSEPLDVSSTCIPSCSRLSCGCHKPSCKSIGCLCCVLQCREPDNPPSTSNLDPTPRDSMYIV